ncbi:MAG: DNA translocase FtsK [Planctomycetaceae bacterium]|jgi:S-DNA-T family DNA segregation ATPase FtsK/SpoIIIE|nr:DNA translocase FtsK [Planctomycetaceae bacterium]
MKPLGTRFIGVVVSTLFVVFAISVLSHSPDDISLVLLFSGQNSVATESANDTGVPSDTPSAIATTPQINSPHTISPYTNPPAADKTVAVPNSAVAQNKTNNNNQHDDEDSDENINSTDTSTLAIRKNVKNLCGPVGAFLSAFAVYFFGQSALLLLLPFGACAVKLLLVQKVDQIMLRGVGFVFALVGFCGMCGLFADRSFSFPLSTTTPGGLVGTTVASILNQNVAVVGSVVLLLSLVVGGSILFADSMLLRLVNLIAVLIKNNSLVENSSNSLPDNSPPNSPQNNSPHNDKPTPQTQSITPIYKLVSERDKERPVVMRCDSDAATDKTSRDRAQTASANCQTANPNNDKINSQTNTQNNRVVPVKKVASKYKLPSAELLTQAEVYNDDDYTEESEQQAIRIEEVFKTFKLQVEVVDVQRGPTVSQFELQLARGLRINKIQQLADDLGLALRVPKVRVVNPIPGKNTLGVELPNQHRRIVRMREIIEQSHDMLEGVGIPIFLGKDVSGEPMISDLATLTHLLIAGRTGTGKSVCLNSIIVSMLMTRTPEEVRMIMIDPKSVELSPYQNIPHLIHPVVIDMSKTEAVLAWVVEKMQERYRLLNAARVVHLNDYNKLPESELRQRMGLNDCDEEEWQVVPKKLPRLVIIIDEFGELMSSVAPREIETHIIRLAQKSRAVGIHLVLATQKPTVDVITGQIKSNLPARISFGVATRADSMVILDQTGAERLLGRGDMLFLNSDKNEINRGQGTFVDRDEIDEIVNAIRTDTPDFIEELAELDENESGTADNYGNNRGIINRKKHKDDETNIDNEQYDELYEKAVEFVIGEGRGSTSLLQRKLSIGYGRAAKMIETMELDGIVGTHNGSQAREVIMTLNEWYKMNSGNNRQNSNAFTLNDKKSTTKILSEVLLNGRTKISPKTIKLPNPIAGSLTNSNTTRPAVQLSTESNNTYFDPDYDIS